MMLFPNAGRKEASALAEIILEQTAEPFDLDGHLVFVTPSIGISIFPDDGSVMGALIKNTDTAMYAAKENRTNGYQFYDSLFWKNPLAASDVEDRYKRPKFE